MLLSDIVTKMVICSCVIFGLVIFITSPVVSCQETSHNSTVLELPKDLTSSSVTTTKLDEEMKSMTKGRNSSSSTPVKKMTGGEKDSSSSNLSSSGSDPYPLPLPLQHNPTVGHQALQLNSGPVDLQHLFQQNGGHRNSYATHQQYGHSKETDILKPILDIRPEVSYEDDEPYSLEGDKNYPPPDPIAFIKKSGYEDENHAEAEYSGHAGYGPPNPHYPSPHQYNPHDPHIPPPHPHDYGYPPPQHYPQQHGDTLGINKLLQIIFNAIPNNKPHVTQTHYPKMPYHEPQYRKYIWQPEPHTYERMYGYPKRYSRHSYPYPHGKHSYQEEDDEYYGHPRKGYQHLPKKPPIFGIPNPLHYQKYPSHPPAPHYHPHHQPNEYHQPHHYHEPPPKKEKKLGDFIPSIGDIKELVNPVKPDDFIPDGVIPLDGVKRLISDGDGEDYEKKKAA